MSRRDVGARLLTKGDALRFVDERAAVLDAASNPPNPFASSAWLRHFIEHVVDDDAHVLAIESHGDGDSATLLLDDRAPWRWTALANYYASLYSPLRSTASDRAAAIVDAVAGLGDWRPRIATLNLAPLDADASDTGALTDALRRDGWYVRRYACFGNWHLPCGGLGYAAYLAGRDSQLRHTLARKARRLDAAGRVEIVTAVDAVDAAIDAYDRVYRSSWKRAEPYAGFVRGWARICAREGWLRLGIARVGDTPVAAQFWFTIDRHAYIFKLAYDEAHAAWSAGTVLTARMIEHALEVDRVVDIDYLTGDDAYKRSWMTHRRQRIGLMACQPRTVRGLARAAWEWGGAVRAARRAAAG